MRATFFVGVLGLALFAGVRSVMPASCPRNGGTLCTGPGEPSHVVTTSYTITGDLPSLVVHTTMVIVWADDRNAATSGSDLYMNTYESCLDSTTAPGIPIVTATGDQKAPAIATTGPPVMWYLGANDFAVIVAWQDERGADADIFALRRFALPPDTPWDTAPIAICSAGADQTDPVVVGGDQGGALFGWIDLRSGARDIYAQATDKAGVPLWTPNGIPVCSAPGDQELLGAVPDGEGGVYFCWLDHRSGDALYAQRITGIGLPASGWNADGNLVASNVRLVGPLKLIVDGNGIVVAWTDTLEDVNGDVLVQRLGTNGSPLAGWPTNGRPIAAGPAAQRVDDLVSDGAAGCCIIWQSAPDGPGNLDLFATRLAADGTPIAGWPAAVSTDPARQDHARATWSGDGLYVIFSDDRSGNRDIFASRLTPNGSVSSGWVANGTMVSNAPNAQDAPVIEPALMGGVQTAWLDERDYATNRIDLYGTNITIGGAVDAPVPVAQSLGLGAPRPNPARGGSTVSLDVARLTWVRVEVIDCTGRRVRSLASGPFDAGRHDISWDERADLGERVAQGVYFIRARIGDSTLQRPVVVLR